MILTALIFPKSGLTRWQVVCRHDFSMLFVILSGPSAPLALQDDKHFFISSSVILFVKYVLSSVVVFHFYIFQVFSDL